jgi:hypothetical protein
MNYTVQEGETLEMIAEKFFGEKSMAGYLASINSLPSVPGFHSGYVYLVSPGQIINVGTPEVEADKVSYWFWGVMVFIAIVFFITYLYTR